MITARYVRSRAFGTVAGLSVPDIAAAALFGALVIAASSGAVHTSRHISAAAAAGMLTMVLPVAWRRPAPLPVAGLLVAATLLNWLLFGPLVRCGVALPAVFLVAFAVGARCDRPRAAAGLLLCVADIAAEAFSDPRIEAPGLVTIAPLLVAFFIAGRLARSRTELAEELRGKSAELRRQREQTARLAVLADRARISADLDATLHARLGGIASAAAAGLDALAAEPAGRVAARQALAGVERDGRAVLGHLREVLGALREHAPSEPPPTLSRLSGLLDRATTADARLTVDGSPRILPAGLELSGYRIVEHLVLALADAPEAVIDVRLRFGQDALELNVSGPPAAGADLRAVLAATRERAALHGGTVDSRVAGGVCHATARLPLITSHA